MAAVIGVSLPEMSKISDTFERHCLRVSLSGIVLVELGFFPRTFFEKLSSVTSMEIMSSLEYQIMPAMEMFSSVLS